MTPGIKTRAIDKEPRETAAQAALELAGKVSTRLEPLDHGLIAAASDALERLASYPPISVAEWARRGAEFVCNGPGEATRGRGR